MGVGTPCDTGRNTFEGPTPTPNGKKTVLRKNLKKMPLKKTRTFKPTDLWQFRPGVHKYSKASLQRFARIFSASLALATICCTRDRLGRWRAAIASMVIPAACALATAVLRPVLAVSAGSSKGPVATSAGEGRFRRRFFMSASPTPACARRPGTAAHARGAPPTADRPHVGTAQC